MQIGLQRGSRRRAHVRHRRRYWPVPGAAAALSITQQAVSKRIAVLEKDLEVQLFFRAARGIRLRVVAQSFKLHGAIAFAAGWIDTPHS